MRLINKIGKKYIIIFCICLLIMTLLAINENGFYSVARHYLSDAAFRHDMNIHALTKFPNIFGVLLHNLGAGIINFDAILITATIPFQIIIPFFSIVGGIFFYKQYNHILKFSLVKAVRFKKEIYKIVFMNAVKLALSVFLAYLCFYTILYFVITSPTQPFHNSSEGRDFLADLLPKGFYYAHSYRYFLLDGFVRFFYMPFIYTVLVQASVLVISSFRGVFLVDIVYYYGLAAIGYATALIAPRLAIYINPTVLMASGDYAHINSLVLLLVNSIPLFISIAIIEWRSRHVEI